MNSRKVSIHCEQCQLANSPHAQDMFEVKVPLSDSISGDYYIARLKCRICSSEHRISLVELRDDEGNAKQPESESRQRIEAVLEQVADKRLCGNADICPSAVVDITRKIQQ